MIQIKLPPSKSISNRVLVLALLNNFDKNPRKIIRNVLKSDDTEVLLNAYKALGVNFQILEQDEISFDIEVRSGISAEIADSQEEVLLFLNNAGTAVRFLLPVLCLFKGRYVLDGNARMRKRPISDLVESLRSAGAVIDYLEIEGFLPLRISVFENNSLQGEIAVNTEMSSQFLSGLLIAESFYTDSVIAPFQVSTAYSEVSQAYVDLTKSVIEEFKSSTEFKVEGDVSSATYWLAIGELFSTELEILDLNLDSLQADLKFLDALWTMRSNSTSSGFAPLVNYDCTEFPDGAMTLAVLCAFAEGKSTLTGLSTWKYKECDRLDAMHTEFAKIGVQSEISEDSITIWGGGMALQENIPAVDIETYDDHRMAMCFSIFKLCNSEVVIKGADCVKKTYPTYWKEFYKVMKNL